MMNGQLPNTHPVLTMHRRRLHVVAVALGLIAAVAYGVEPLAVGSRMPEITLADQHDAAGTIGPSVRLVVFTRDMDAGDIVKEALAEQGAALLESARAVYVADIARMPAIISKLFAVPAMRKRAYRMLLDRDGTATAAFPAVDKKVTLMQLRALTVEHVDYVDSVAALRAALQATATPPPAAAPERE